MQKLFLERKRKFKQASSVLLGIGLQIEKIVGTSIEAGQSWVKWINSIYLKNQSVWVHELKLDVSWYWRKLMNIRGCFSLRDIYEAGCTGKFKISSLYDYFLSDSTRVKFDRVVWSRMTIPGITILKHKFTLWQALRSHLLTRDHLASRNISIDSDFYPFCETSEENHGHLFFDCVFSTRVIS
ncbi:hypothetical protein CsatA_001437 [Cannabis sativa]